jgi:hemerythrin-like metal-binding protein
MRIPPIQDLLVGHAQIDEDHDRILRRLTAVQAGVAASNSAALGSALAGLWDEIVGHFAAEEALMDVHAYPERVAHRNAHHLFLEDLRALIAEREASGVTETVASWALRRMPEWVTFHIQTNDGPLARFLVRKAARQLVQNAMGAVPPSRTHQES